MARADVMVRVSGETRKRLKVYLRDPRRLLETGFPNPQSLDDVINGLIDYLEQPIRGGSMP